MDTITRHALESVIRQDGSHRHQFWILRRLLALVIPTVLLFLAACASVPPQISAGSRSINSTALPETTQAPPAGNQDIVITYNELGTCDYYTTDPTGTQKVQAGNGYAYILYQFDTVDNSPFSSPFYFTPGDISTVDNSSQHIDPGLTQTIYGTSYPEFITADVTILPHQVTTLDQIGILRVAVPGGGAQEAGQSAFALAYADVGTSIAFMESTEPSRTNWPVSNPCNLIGGIGTPQSPPVSTNGDFVSIHAYQAGQFTTAWSAVAATAGGMIFYDATSGAAVTGAIDDSGNFHTLNSYPAGLFATGWTSIVGTTNYLLFYNSNTGSAATGAIDGSGNFHTQQTYGAGRFATGWTTIAAEGNELLFYNRATGAAAVGTIGNGGNFSTENTYQFGSGWTTIAATATDLLFYCSSNGRGATGTIDGSGNFKMLKSYAPGQFSTGWTHVVGTTNFLLFYSTVTGAGATGSIDSTGNFKTLQSYAAGQFTTQWTSVTAMGKFLLFYNADSGSGVTGVINP